MVIGVLALQGSVEEHSNMIRSFGDDVSLVRYPHELDSVQALIIPGGESTAILKLLKIQGLDVAIKEKASNGLPIWGTCAGLIMLSKEVYGEQVETLNLIDIETKRNGYGTQIDSFTTEVNLNNRDVKVRFIRAPRIISTGLDVEVLTEYNGESVAVRSGNILATTFHPEITNDKSFYKYFRSFIEKAE